MIWVNIMKDDIEKAGKEFAENFIRKNNIKKVSDEEFTKVNGELSDNALQLMVEEKLIEELIEFYNERTQFYKVRLLQIRLKKLKKKLEMFI